MKKAVRLKTEPVVAEPKEPPPSDFIDIPGAAAIVFVSQATIRRMLTRHELTRFKFGSRTLISRTEVHSKIRPAAQ